MAALSNRLDRSSLERLALILGPFLAAVSTATVTAAYYEVHGPVLHALIFLSLLWLYVRSRDDEPREGSRWLFLISGIFLLYALVAILAAGRAGFDTAALNRLDHFSYFLAGAVLIPFLAAARARPPWFWIAVAAAALLSGLYAYWEVQTFSVGYEQTHGFAYRASGSKGKQIPFGDIATLAAALSVLAACVHFPARRIMSGLFLAAALAGGYASIASGTRGAWVFIPSAALVIALYLLQRYPARRRRLLVGAAVLLLLGGIAVIQSSQIRERFSTAAAEIVGYEAGDGVEAGNSLGERFEMWRAAGMAYREHPWLGIGLGKLNAYFKSAAERGLISPAVIEFNNGEGHTHAHNDYIHVMATRGLLGLTTLLLLYLVPLGLFIRTAVAAVDPEIRAIGYAGILCILGYMQFSLTDSILLMRITAGYFVLLVSWLLAMCLSTGRRGTA